VAFDEEVKRNQAIANDDALLLQVHFDLPPNVSLLPAYRLFFFADAFPLAAACFSSTWVPSASTARRIFVGYGLYQTALEPQCDQSGHVSVGLTPSSPHGSGNLSLAISLRLRFLLTPSYFLLQISCGNNSRSSGRRWRK
jgi:hypothetical protein